MSKAGISPEPVRKNSLDFLDQNVQRIPAEEVERRETFNGATFEAVAVKAKNFVFTATATEASVISSNDSDNEVNKIPFSKKVV